MPYNKGDEFLEVSLDANGMKEVKGKTKEGNKGFLKQVKEMKDNGL